MHDPRREPTRFEDFHPASGIVGVFAPVGSVGCCAGAIIAIVYSVASGLVTGVWVVVAVAALIALVPLTIRALKWEMARQDASTARSRLPEATLPADSELSDAERRDAMRRYGQPGGEGDE